MLAAKCIQHWNCVIGLLFKLWKVWQRWREWLSWTLTRCHTVDEIYCFCDKPDTGELMVICEKCDQSYHAPCVGFDKDTMANDDWLCGYCQSDVCGDGKREWKGEVPIPEERKDVRSQSPAVTRS